MAEDKTTVQLDEAQTKELSESIGSGVFAKVKEFLGNKGNETKPEDFEQAVTAKASEIAEKAVQEKLNELIPELKKTKEAELQAKQQELEAQQDAVKAKEAEAQMAKELELVDEQYQDYVKFQAEQAGKTITDFVEENPQYKINQPNVQTQHAGGTANEVQLDESESRMVAALRETGVF